MYSYEVIIIDENGNEKTCLAAVDYSYDLFEMFDNIVDWKCRGIFQE